MQEIYRGHEINVTREEAMGGWDQLFISIVRLDDQYMVEDTFSTGEDKVEDMMRYMKERVDAEIENGTTYECVKVAGVWKPKNKAHRTKLQMLLDRDED